MSYPGDSYYQPEMTGWQRFAKAMSASFKVGHFFGVEVRIFWITMIIMPLLFFSSFEGFAFVERSVHTLILLVLLYFVIYTHEMGHIVAGWRYRMRTPLITLSPLGGLAHMETPAPGPKVDAIVSLAGPATHLIWLLVFGPLWLFVFRDSPEILRPEGWWLSPAWLAVQFLAVTNLVLMLFNLLPFFPMDGGRTLRAFLATKMHPNRATLIAAQIGLVGASFFVLGWIFFDFMGHSWILMAIGISHFMVCLQARKAARYGFSPYDATAQLEAWQRDADAWKRGGQPSGDPGYFERRRADKEQRRREKQREDAAALELEVDRILEKVSEVGMAGLTEKEKRTLMRASDERKKR